MRRRIRFCIPEKGTKIAPSKYVYRFSHHLYTHNGAIQFVFLFCIFFIFIRFFLNFKKGPLITYHMMINFFANFMNSFRICNCSKLAFSKMVDFGVRKEVAKIWKKLVNIWTHSKISCQKAKIGFGEGRAC